MQEEINKQEQQEEIAKEKLTGRECPYCDRGTLTEGKFKGDFAILCSACETPAYRTFL